MGPDEIHPGVLRELADAVAKPLSTINERSWQSGESLVTGKKVERCGIFGEPRPCGEPYRYSEPDS